MNRIILLMAAIAGGVASFGQPVNSKASTGTMDKKNLFIDVHNLEPGKVTFADVMAAHQKDLATEGKHDVSFLKFWVDEKGGKVYCLSSAKDTQSVIQTHAEAHGLLPAAIFKVTDGLQANAVDGNAFFMDVHTLGAGKVTAADVAGAHNKDLAAQEKHGVNFINYWVNEKNGIIFCLSQAADSNEVIKTHKEATWLVARLCGKSKTGGIILSGRGRVVFPPYQIGLVGKKYPEFSVLHRWLVTLTK